ncbi:4-hydroxy-tetrahydrodipicolinate synthase [Salimicrobium jeotgali]|uniref:4-hydroxy-tetrahydrodipicolinate synthase n=1 Tax=Salimicrobium jeotgali TaxID=1230341 RepID=K2GMI7_9BACI|nr:4-hydroxy-tetrahydrodipicolinate synthase [Salimicrobium jeotgali]AKG04932.1 4-hydroxy-tetrahydrodipicolinate synthase [Salimicrobium jeotgali]EKE31609.1 dihydrodipicolinate synthase [Salimicrobium jeotgali]MBM7696430.1 4-hydroxy-tetrahydrodipicolinate synthase [Salimicrobium jeotgali]
MNFGQLLTAMVTPFDDQEDIDYNRTRNLVEHLILHGSEGLVVAGTTGESPTLTAEEKVELCRFVVEVADGRVPVIAGTGSNNTKATVELTKRIEAVGVDGIMLVAPYYSKPSQEGLYRHFSQVAAATSLPVMLYNIPGRSVVNIEPDTIIRLAEIKNIVSVKEASGDLDAATRIISQTPQDFSVYTGEDSLTLPMLSVGGAGVISVSSHVIGDEMKDMIDSYKRGDVKTAATLHGYILPMMKLIFAQPSPSPVKEALNYMGVSVGSVRLPMIPLDDAECSALHNMIDIYQQKKVASI